MFCFCVLCCQGKSSFLHVYSSVNVRPLKGKILQTRNINQSSGYMTLTVLVKYNMCDKNTTLSITVLETHVNVKVL